VIALQLAERAIEGTEPKAEQAMFAEFYVADMLKKLIKADYEVAFYAQERVARRNMKRRRRSVKKRNRQRIGAHARRLRR